MRYAMIVMQATALAMVCYAMLVVMLAGGV